MSDEVTIELTRREFLQGGLSAALLAAGMRVGAPFAAVGALSGCATDRTREQMARRVVVAMRERIRSLDPAYMVMANDGFISNCIHESLTWYTRDIQLVPKLALEWNSPDGGSSWLFKLRPDVRFHDGSPFNAAAVKFHFDRLRDPVTKSKRASKVSRIRSTEVVDDLTVQFNMSEPYSVWPIVMRDSFAGIVSPEEVRRLGNEAYTLKPSGTGAYKLLSNEANNVVVLGRNRDYWSPEELVIEEVEFRLVPEATTRFILVEQGAIDLASLNFAHTEVAEKSGKVQVLDEPALAVRYVGFNCMKPPFDNVLVRRAANMAVDRQALVQHAFRGNADPLVGPLPTVMPTFNRNMQTYAYDPEMARSLLKQAGVKTPIRVVMWTKDDVDDTNLGVVVADQLRHVGIEVELIRYDRNVYWEKFDPYQTLSLDWYPTKEGVFDMYAAGWVGQEHPHGYLDPLFRSTSTSNSSFYKNVEVDRLLADSLKITDEQERQAVYDRLQEILVEEAPWIYAYSARTIWGVNPRIKNFHIHPGGEYEFQGLRLDVGDGRV